jgi:homoserine/homoserine lactone efflux protein
VNLELYLAFVLATTVMILLPGPSVLLTVSHSLAFGADRALLTVTGAVLAIGVQLIVTIVGMTSLMLLLAEGFEVLRWAGVAWLVWLGIQQWRAPADLAGIRPVEGRRLLVQGFLVTIANPKSLLFLAAFFPQFVDPGRPLGPQLVLLGISFLVIGFVFTALWGVAAGWTRSWFQSRPRLLLRNRISGSLLIGAGIGLAMVRRT